MTSAYNRCKEYSQKHRDTLEQQLNKAESNDIVTHYESIAKAFPSVTPSEHSLEIPLINEIKLISWAKDRGWDVKLAPELTSQSEQKMPPVRFIKMA